METQINESAPVSTRTIGIRFGLIGAVVMVVYLLVLNVAHLESTRGLWSWLGYLITAFIVFFAQKSYKVRGDGFMTYGQGIGIAFWIGLVSGVISSVFNYLYIKFVDTGFMELIKERQIEQMQQQGLSDEQIDKAVEFSEMFMSPEALLIFMVFGSIIATIIIGLIVTIFTQKNNPEPAF